MILRGSNCTTPARRSVLTTNGARTFAIHQLSRSYEPATEADEGGIQARVWPSRLRRLGGASRSTRRQVRRPARHAVQRRAVAQGLRNNEQMLSTTRAAR